MFRNINLAISLLKNRDPISVIVKDKGVPVKGRRSMAPSRCYGVSDCVHFPVSDSQDKRREGNDSTNIIAGIIKDREILTTTNSNDSFHVIIEGTEYEVTRVKNWSTGQFFEFEAVEIQGNRGNGFVYFRALTSTQSTSPSPAIRFETIKKGFAGTSSQRQFRFNIPDCPDNPVVGVAYPVANIQQEDTIQIRAINSNGQAVPVAPISTVNSANYRIVMLPKILSQNNRIEYEVF
jgi:hypothetical protein